MSLLRLRLPRLLILLFMVLDIPMLTILTTTTMVTILLARGRLNLLLMLMPTLRLTHGLHTVDSITFPWPTMDSTILLPTMDFTVPLLMDLATLIPTLL